LIGIIVIAYSLLMITLNTRAGGAETRTRAARMRPA
jgi:hypothetical protein